jgi:hypothetical protein
VTPVEPREAGLHVLGEAEEPLHWTVVLDRALRGGLLDPFEVRDVRGTVQRALAGLGRDGLARKVSTGVWELSPEGRSGP